MSKKGKGKTLPAKVLKEYKYDRNRNDDDDSINLEQVQQNSNSNSDYFPQQEISQNIGRPYVQSKKGGPAFPFQQQIQSKKSFFPTEQVKNNNYGLEAELQNFDDSFNYEEKEDLVINWSLIVDNLFQINNINEVLNN